MIPSTSHSMSNLLYVLCPYECYGMPMILCEPVNYKHNISTA